ncbi:hypothetical protein RB195_009446 [Necator americanus]|uniref:Major facilitator superfamily (MFS) profile domain-containing protein n=1 Tax=Necator americanus TaxID=51031 RepID=A0ABR1CWQ1_NECAM
MCAETNSISSGSIGSSSSGFNDSDDYRQVLCGCAGANRYGILALTLCYLSFLMSSLIAFNATFVAMMDKTTSPLYNGSITDDIDWQSSELSIGDRRLSFDVMEKSLTFAGGFTGAMLITFPLNMLLQRFGTHKVMTVVGVVCTLMVAVTPVIVCWSFPVFVVVRIISGISISNSFPVAGAVINEWASTKEKGFFIAVLSAYVELSALFTMPISGLVATKVSWDFVFYLHAVILGIFTVLWAVYYRDKPKKHPFVARGEWQKISLGKKPVSGKTSPPLQRIFRSMVIWAIWIAVIGNFLVSQFTISYSPLYLSYVLGFPTMTAGFLTIAPLAVQLVIKMFTGLASDRLRCLPEVGKLRLFNSVALLGSGLFFILLSVVPPAGNASDVILIIIPVALLGFSSGGYPKCAVMVSQQHSPFVMSIVQIVACFSLLIGSFVVPALTKNDTFDQWRTVFLIYAFVLTLSNTIFIAFARTRKKLSDVDSFTTCIQDAARETLPVLLPRKKFVFASAETKSTYNSVCVARSAGDFNQEKRHRRKLHRQLQQDRDNEWTSRAMKFEKVWKDRNLWKAYALLKQCTGKIKKCFPVLNTANGVAVGEAILPIWKQHFMTLLNRLAPSASELEHVHRPTYAVNEEPPTESEVLVCIQKMKNGKCGGDDGISAEMLKYLPPSGIREMTKIIRSI